MGYRIGCPKGTPTGRSATISVPGALPSSYGTVLLNPNLIVGSDVVLTSTNVIVVLSRKLDTYRMPVELLGYYGGKVRLRRTATIAVTTAAGMALSMNFMQR
jgi:hypothetical protein